MSIRPLSPLASPVAMPGKLGKYQLTGVLGEGAMGVVYKGIDPVIQRVVAVKAIRKQLFDASTANLSVAQRFRNEAQAAGRLSHPGIVGVYEYGEDDGDAYIAMEYVEGVSLSQLMQNTPRMPEADVLSLMVQLLDALHYAHQRGVWHRDVKPNNIVVTPTGQLKVTDFGIARIESSEATQLTVLLGSPGYIAPERYTGESPDWRVDIFSCGVLLYHLLTGRPPFTGSEAEVMYQVLHEHPTPPSQTAAAAPRCFDGIVARALAKKPDDRYRTAFDFREALQNAGALPVPPTLSIEVMTSVRQRIERTATLKLPRSMPGVPPEAASAPSAGPSSNAPSAAPAVAPASLPLASSPSLPPATDSAAAGPVSVPASPTGWDTTLLAKVEAQLARHVGPIAAVLVRRTARQCAGLPELLARLADEALAGDERAAFVAATAPLAAAGAPPPLPAAALRGGGGPTTRPPTAQLPVLAVAPLRPETVEQAERVLAGYIGPIARVVTKKAAAAAAGRDEFYAVLAELAADSVDRATLLKALSRIA